MEVGAVFRKHYQINTWKFSEHRSLPRSLGKVIALFKQLLRMLVYVHVLCMNGHTCEGQSTPCGSVLSLFCGFYTWT